MTRMIKWTAMLAALALALSACAEKKSKYQESSVENLYKLAYSNMGSKRYRFAAAAFDEVERQHPYSAWARRAQLMSAYNHYLSNDYDNAILAAQRFLALHPGNDSAPYAFYLIGTSYYEQISDVGRDQRMTELALLSMNEIIRRFPDSEYAADARLKLDLTLDHLAGKEMEIGRWYMRQGHYLSAIMRYQNVVSQYDRTSHVPEALHRLTETYLSLGVINEAQAAAAALGYNYPTSRWYRDSYALLEERGIEPLSKEGWFARLVGTIF